MKIRRANINDFEAIFILLKQLWPKRKLRKGGVKKVFRKALQDKNQVFFVAELDKKVIGFASLEIIDSFWDEGLAGYMNEFIISKEFRQRGIGQELLKKVLNTAKKRKCKRIELDSAFWRKRAHRFYTRKGFECSGYIFSRDV